MVNMDHKGETCRSDLLQGGVGLRIRHLVFGFWRGMGSARAVAGVIRRVLTKL